MSRRDEPPPMQRLPADVERPDTILFGLTGRQVIILGATGLLLWAIWTCGVLPAGVFLAGAAPIGAAGFFLAVGRRDGVSLDQWLLAALTHRRTPHQLVPAEAPIQAAPRWVAASGAGTGRDLPAVLRLPARGITADGLVDLGPDGTAALVACSTVNFHLRSGLEQRGLVGGYARWLNSLDSPVHILIRSRRVDLTAMAEQVESGAAGLPDPALEDAARDHAAFLRELATTRELLHREVFVVVRDTRSPVHTVHRAAEAARGLGACEITAEVLGPDESSAVLADCLGAAPPPSGMAAPSAIIHAAPGRNHR